jgi:hypothetical protein
MLSRTEQVQFCKQCTNRVLDPKQGLICKLTNAKADFEEECKDFVNDENYEVRNPEEEIEQEEEFLVTEEILEALRTEQHFSSGVTFSILAAVLGAVLWAVITVATEYQIGYMALAVGAGVGIANRFFGRGIDQKFGIVGGIAAGLGCVLGNFLSVVGFFANAEGLGYFETLSLIEPSAIFSIIAETTQGIDFLFYGIAIYEGYKFSFRRITKGDLVNQTA